MEFLNFSELTDLVNRLGGIHIASEPVAERQISNIKQWAEYQGQTTIGNLAFEFSIIWIYADITVDGLKSALNHSSRLKRAVEIVYAPSAFRSSQDSRETLRKTPKAQSAQDYLLSLLSRHIENYRDAITRQKPEHYIDPRLVGEDSSAGKAVLNYLLQKEDGKEKAGALVGVVLAEPGQGKTFFTWQIAQQLLGGGLIPIYVSSEQWRDGHQADLASLMTTVLHAFQHHHSTLGFISGFEEQFLRVTLKARLFQLVFDGFDEFVLRNQESVSAHEILRKITGIARDTGVPVLISSRTSFWRNVLETPTPDIQSTDYRIFQLAPFDRVAAAQYFKQRFDSSAPTTESETSQRTALIIYDSVRTVSHPHGTDFTGRGFFLALIAELAAQKQRDVSDAVEPKRALRWIIDQLCRREDTRQQLGLDSARQQQIFRRVAEWAGSKRIFSDDDLELALSDLQEIPEPKRRLLLGTPGRGDTGKLKDHPLLRRSKDGIWNFVQDQVFYLFSAEALLLRIMHQKDQQLIAESYLKSTGIGEDRQLLWEVAESVVDNLELSARGDMSMIRKVTRELLAFAPAAPTRFILARRFATVVALTAIALRTASISHQERRKELQHFFPRDVFEGGVFSGSLVSLDLRGIAFDHCTFENVSWKNCEFSEETTFTACTFHGGEVIGGSGFGMAQKDKQCTVDETAYVLFARQQLRSLKKKYNLDDLRHDFEAILKKLDLDGKPVEEGYLLRGTVGLSQYGKIILEQALNSGVIDKDYRGLGHQPSYLARQSALTALIFFKNNAAMTGSISMAFKRAADVFGLKVGG